MAITSEQLKIMKSTTVNDGSTNGGRMSANEIPDSVKNNLWPDVPQAERVAGSIKYRKTFLKVANPENKTLAGALIFVETPSSGDDRLLIFPGTQTDTQDDLTGVERLYGCGNLDVSVVAGATTIQVNVEDGGDAIFQDSDLIRISNKVSVDAEDGTTEFLRVAADNAITWNGNQVTLTLDSGVETANAYTSSDTRVASVIEAGDAVGNTSNWGISSASGNYAGTVEVDSIGGIEQVWTITFTSSTTFVCTGDVLGDVGGGTTNGTDFAPINPTFSTPCFTLPSSGWSGVWTEGEYLAFTTHPAAFAVWQKRVIPAGAAAATSDAFIGVDGQTA